MESHDRDITNIYSKGTGFLEWMTHSNEDSPTYVSVGRRFLWLLRRVLSRQKIAKGSPIGRHNEIYLIIG
jgi:hypothetical protein